MVQVQWYTLHPSIQKADLLFPGQLGPHSDSLFQKQKPKKKGSSKMVQQINMLAAKPNDLSWNPKTHSGFKSNNMS